MGLWLGIVVFKECTVGWFLVHPGQPGQANWFCGRLCLSVCVFACISQAGIAGFMYVQDLNWIHGVHDEMHGPMHPN